MEKLINTAIIATVVLSLYLTFNSLNHLNDGRINTVVNQLVNNTAQAEIK